MMVIFTSSVVFSGFLGFDARNDCYKDKSILETLLFLTELGIATGSDPLILIFGEKLMKMRWRKKDK